MAFEFGPRRGIHIDISDELGSGSLRPEEVGHFESLDEIYRSLVALMFNYVPMSGHPGGSVSSGRFVAALLFDAMDYDLAQPLRDDADIISYAAGHKALGLYGMWALRNEIARVGKPELLAKEDKLQMRLEDLLGFRRNPVTKTPLFKRFGSKALDGHPTPATPFVRLATGASGVGVAASLGLAFAAADRYGTKAPRVHIVEGEGGMTPGRVSEAMAAAGTACLGNAILHVDWNQASIDSNRVCRDGDQPGDYVQWTPAELAYLHDWNVIEVPDGFDFAQIVAAQRRAAALDTGQPTAIVYRTVKGWNYGIEGRASHGAGHTLCSEGFYDAAGPLLEGMGDVKLPGCADGEDRCESGVSGGVVEECYWDALGIVRKAIETRPEMTAAMGGRLAGARQRLEQRERRPRDGAPNLEAAYDLAKKGIEDVPADLQLSVGIKTTLRAELGRVLNHYNRKSGGAFLAASADLLGSTSTHTIADGLGEGFFNAKSNPGGRLLSLGGICEDATAGILSGIASYGHHIGAGSSYGAFNAALGHVAARLHAIGNQARHEIDPGPYRPFFLVCAHAGLKTGEDGPTHADPQALQLVQENFPRGTAVTLTPWDPAELWPLVTTVLAKRPAVVTPFVTRPNETVLDREALRLAPAADAAKGVYRLRAGKSDDAGTVVLQGSGVTYAFLEDALPQLDADGVDLNVYYVASAELFDMLPADEQARIFPEAQAQCAMGITGFTLPTMFRWVRSDAGRAATLHPFAKGHFLGSGQANMVLEEAGLDGASQVAAIKRWVG